MQPELDFDEALAFAGHLAHVAGAQILPYFRQALIVENKALQDGGAYDPVTAADRAAERGIRDAIAKRYPEHDVIGEEFANAGTSARYRWLIDPIDGTRSFIMGLPLWGTLIALCDTQSDAYLASGAPLLGIMNQPYTGEHFWSTRDAAWWRATDGVRPLRTRTCTRLADAVFSTTHPDLFADGFEADRFIALKTQARMTRYGGDCYAYCMLAMGGIDLIVESGLKPFDIAALVPIIERAGGRVTGWDGAPALASTRIVACGDPGLHEQVMQLLAG